jgi:hypothetical protein
MKKIAVMNGEKAYNIIQVHLTISSYSRSRAFSMINIEYERCLFSEQRQGGLAER